jgi:hypothetical protein
VTTNIELTGGPHGRNTKLLIDGHEMHGLHRVELVADVNDVIRVTAYHYAAVTASVEGVDAQAWVAKVQCRSEERWEVVAEATADKLSQALFDCARQLELVGA